MLRGERLIKNQIFVRDVNARVHEAAQALGESAGEPTQLFEVFCECSRKRCFERIELTLDEYDRVRADPTAFAVVSGHEVSSIEEVVERNPRFITVRKFHPETVRIAREAHRPGGSAAGADDTPVGGFAA